MVIVQIMVVALRYVFGVGSIFMQESIVYMHGVLFMVGAAYTLQHEGHVRIDIFYREATERRKAMVNMLGVAFLLLPVCFIIFRYSLPYVLSSWRVFEGSKETSGIQGVFLLKSVILAFTILVALQGLSLAIHALLTFSGRGEVGDVRETSEF
jgi:TRAP-type mannitol/chloroaromatic compound transport system permease small subunit